MFERRLPLRSLDEEKINIALLKNHFGEIVESRATSFDQLFKTFSTPKIGRKTGPAWMPAKIPKGPRRKENVQHWNLLVLDVETITSKGVTPPSVDAICCRLQELNWSAIVHTTFSHKLEAPRYRIVLRTSRCIEPEEIRPFGLWAANLLGISDCIDTSALEPARLFYFPRCAEENREAYISRKIDGSKVDLALFQEKEQLTSRENIQPLMLPAIQIAQHQTLGKREKAQAAISYINADCDYQTWRNVIWALISTGWDSAEQLAREWSLTAPDRFEEKAFQSVVDSFRIDRGITLGTLFHYAKAAGWSEEDSSQTKDSTHRFSLLTFEQVQKLPPTRWLVKGLIPKAGIAAIYGPPGSGKSFVVLDMLLRLSLNLSWFEYGVKHCPVVYVALEGTGGLTNRLRAWCQHHKQPPEHNFRIVINPFSLLSADIEELAAEINAQSLGGGVIALDTLAQSAPGTDENSSADMGNVISRVQRLQALTGSLVLLVHHTGKDTARGLRGHSSLLGALDAAIEVTKSDGGCEWKVKKSKDGLDGVGSYFSLKVVTLGTDDDGDEISSCVVEPDFTRTLASRKHEPRGKNQKAALRVIKLVAGTLGRAETGKVMEQLISDLDGTSSRHKPERAKKAINDLIEGGIIREKKGSYEVV